MRQNRSKNARRYRAFAVMDGEVGYLAKLDQLGQRVGRAAVRVHVADRLRGLFEQIVGAIDAAFHRAERLGVTLQQAAMMRVDVVDYQPDARRVDQKDGIDQLADSVENRPLAGGLGGVLRFGLATPFADVVRADIQKLSDAFGRLPRDRSV